MTDRAGALPPHPRFDGACRHTATLSNPELQQLIRAQLRARAPEPIAEDELKRIADWVQEVRTSTVLADMLMDGELVGRFPDEGADDPTFETPGATA